MDKIENLCRHFLPAQEQKEISGVGTRGYANMGCYECPGNNTDCDNWAKERRFYDRREEMNKTSEENSQ